MTISETPRTDPRDDRPPEELPREKRGLVKRLSRRGRVLTAVALVWVVALVAAAAFVVFRSDPGQPASAGQPVVPAAAGALDARLYVDPNSQAASWVKAHAGTSEAKTIQQRIADQPTGKWFGAWSGDITSAVSQYVGAAAQQNKTPVLVAYNLPNRDCGGQSAGGAATAADYSKWIDGFASGIGNRPALVILEPDSLAMLDGCLSPADQQARLKMLSQAVDRLESKNVWVYLDAGHSSWVPADQMAQRLKAANIATAHGFSLNVSNYNPTGAEVAYGQQIDSALGQSKPFVVDTSRNGNGSANGDWCNPAGRKLGPAPQAGGGAEMMLWVKAPGESDGNCGIGQGTQAGQFSPKIAQQLINGH